MIKKAILIITIALVIVIILFASITIVGTGQVGVITRFGAVQERMLEEGIHMKLPFIESVKRVDIKVQREDIDGSSASKDLQDVSINVAVNYRVDGLKARDIIREVGVSYADILLRPAVQESIKSSTAMYTAEELITKRQEVSNKITTTLNEKLNMYGIKIDNINILNFAFSNSFNQAIEQKQIAQQEALKAEQDLERIKIEAEQKVVQAQAEADSLRIQKQEITAELLELRKIEAQMEAIRKWNGVMPNTVLGDTVPFLNIN